MPDPCDTSAHFVEHAGSLDNTPLVMLNSVVRKQKILEFGLWRIHFIAHYCCYIDM
jgi:hypothetical protein